MKRLHVALFPVLVAAGVVAAFGFSSSVYAGASVCKESAVTEECVKEKERVVAEAQTEVTRIEAQLKTAKANLSAAQRDLQKFKDKKRDQEDGPRK